MLPEDERLSQPDEPAVELISPDAVLPPEAAAKPPREPFWGYDDLALIFGLVFASFIVLGVFVAGLALLYPRLQRDQSPLVLPVQVAAYVAIYYSFKLVFGLRYRRPVLASLGWVPSRMNLLLAAVGGVILALVLSGLGALLRAPKIASPFDKMAAGPVSLTFFGILAITLAPFFEELFFRGFVQPLLSRTFGTIAGIVTTAFLFGALHAPEYSRVWQYVLLVTLAGVVFGWIRAKTGSIIPSTVMHGCFNAVSVVALAFGKNI